MLIVLVATMWGFFIHSNLRWRLPKRFPSAYGIDAKLPASLSGQLLYPLLPQPSPLSLPEPVLTEPFTPEPNATPIAHYSPK